MTVAVTNSQRTCRSEDFNVNSSLNRIMLVVIVFIFNDGDMNRK